MKESTVDEVGLLDEMGRPLHLYLLDGRPVTGKNGVPLFNICGNILLTFEVDRTGTKYYDMKGSPLADLHGRVSGDKGYNPSEGPPKGDESTHKCDKQVFALDGHPLTDTDGVPLLNGQGKYLVVFNPKGHPVTDLEGRDLTDSEGRVLYPDERPYLSKERLPLRIFDELGRPLTDENGFPMTDIIGSQLIINDRCRNPIATVKGYSLRDADGLFPWDDGYSLTKVPKYNKINKAILYKKKHGIAFDRYGHPLTDMDGFPLFNLEGTALVRKHKNSWVDSSQSPVILIQKSLFDKDALRYLKNSKGTPVRLYDQIGYALTDHEGRPLKNVEGLLLIRFNELGEPVSDAYGNPTYDSKGNPYGSPCFRPCKDFKINTNRENLKNTKNTEFQFYDEYGMPVTNCEGIPLLNANQEFMVQFDNFKPRQDIYENVVFDILSLPVGSFGKSLRSPTGESIRLYNKLGKPLTDKDGNVLKTVKSDAALETNYAGRIESDSKGGPFFDADGCPMSMIDQFSPTKYPPNEIWTIALKNLDGKPLVIYDLTGEPLTDSKGRILFDNSGIPLISIDSLGFVHERNGEFILDQDGFTNLKIAGRALSEKIAIYDEYGRPLLGPSGFILRLRTGKEILTFDSYGYPVSTVDNGKIYDCNGRPIFTTSSNIFVVPDYEYISLFEGKFQLFDCEDRPLLDITGTILVTSRGVPLVELTSNFKPRSDALGRPIFDENGIPICNPGGVWRDQAGNPYHLYDNEYYPVTDLRGKELVDIDGRPLLKQDEYGRPMFDLNGNYLCDAEGHKITTEHFLGTAVPPKRRASSLMESKNVPLRLFDKTGRPLTDECGKPLETLKGRPILDMTKGYGQLTDLLGRTVYDYRRLPVGCNAYSQLLTAEGQPIVLYNKDGNPLTTFDGVPIKRVDGSCLLKFDHYGRPIGADNSGLYDQSGVSVDSPDCRLVAAPHQNISLMSLEGRPVKVYDRNGMPLTDDMGNVLYKSNGETVKTGSWGDNLG